MQWQSHVNYYGVSSCNETLSASGFTNLTVYTAGCGSTHSTKKHQRILFYGLVLSKGMNRYNYKIGVIAVLLLCPFLGRAQMELTLDKAIGADLNVVYFVDVLYSGCSV